MFNVISISSETLTSNISPWSMINWVCGKAKAEWVPNDNEKIQSSDHEFRQIESETSHVKLSIKDWKINFNFKKTVDNNCDVRLIDNDSSISLFNHVCLSKFTNQTSVSKSSSQGTVLSQNSKTMQMSLD